jgi:predicted nucleic acid-binding protein
MIVLDTPVITEILRPKPHKSVLEWLNAQDAQQLFLTAITIAELFSSLENLPDAEQKAQISTLMLEMLNQDFTARLLPFDAQSALLYAPLQAANLKAEVRLSVAELQKVAICQQHQACLATSDIGYFANCGITLLNPWENQGSPRWREEAAEYFVMSRKS